LISLMKSSKKSSKKKVQKSSYALIIKIDVFD
jgi:hypothetical protein